MAKLASALKRTGLVVLATLGVLALTAVALVASFAYHSRLPLARSALGELIEGVFAAEMKGSLEIGRIEHVGPAGIDASGLTLRDGMGTPIVRAGRLTLVPEWASLRDAILRGGSVRIASARLRDGEVTLIDDGTGLPTLLTTFDSRVPSAPSAEPAAPILVDGIALERVTVTGELLGLRGLRATELNARGAMQIGSDVLVRIDDAHMNVVAPFPYPARVESLSGTISTRPHEGVQLSVAAVRGDERVSGRVVFAAPSATAPEQELLVDLQLERVTSSTVQGLGFEFVPTLATDVSGHFALRGPIDALVLDAELTSAAGPIDLRGEIASDSGYRVVIATTRLQLDRAVPDAPALTVAGEVELAAKPGETAPHVRIALEPVVLDAFALPAFVAEGVLDGATLRVDSLRATQRGARLSGNGVVSLTGAVDFSIDASIDDLGRDPSVGRYLPDAHGRLDASVRITMADVRRDRMSFRGRVVLTRFSYAQVHAARVSLEGSVRGDPEQPALRISLLGKDVRVGNYPLGDADLSVTGGPREYRAEGQIVRAGRRDFHLAARARVEQGALVIDADPIELQVADNTWRGTLRGLRIVGDREVQLELLRLASRAQRLEASAHVRARGADEANVLLQGFDLSAVAALLGDAFPLREGNADAQLQLRGDLSAPDIELQGALRDGTVLDVTSVNAVYFASYRAGQLEVDGEVDLGDRGLVQARGSGSLDARISDPIDALLTGRYALTLGSQALCIELLPAIAARGIEGRLSGEVRIEGSLEAPELRGSIELDPLQVPGAPPLQIATSIDQSGRALELRTSIGDERGPLALVQTSTELGLRDLFANPQSLESTLRTGPWKLAAQGIERSLDRMPQPIAEAAPYPVPFAFDVELQMQRGAATGHGTWTARIDAPLETATCAVEAKPRARGSFALEGGVSTLEVVALLGPRRLASTQLRIETPVEEWLRRGELPQLTAYSARTRIDIPSIEDVPYLCEYGRGNVRGELELDSGPNATPIAVASLESTFVPITVKQGGRNKTRVRGCENDPLRIEAEMQADDERLEGTVRMHGCHGGASELRGTLPVDWDALHALPTPNRDRPLSATIQLDGAQLEPLVDRIPGVRNTDALARGRIDLQGSLRDVRASGRVTVEQGRLYLVTTGQALSEIGASIDFRGNWAKIERLSVRSGSGQLELEGGLSFDGLWPRRAQLAVLADGFPVQREGVDVAWVTGSAALDADILPERLRAVVKLHDATVLLPDAESRALQPLDPHPDVIVDDLTRAVVSEPYPVELVLDGRRGMRVRRNDFDTRVITELAVQYRDPDLRVGGYIEFRSGRFETLGRPFAIERGSLRFDGGTTLNPEVNLLATHQPEFAGSSPVMVAVSGTLADPLVVFSSDACPGDTGAVTYLISGQCVADDPDLAQESEDAQAAFNVGIAGSGILTLLGGAPKVEGVTPRVGVESGGRGYDARFKAGVGSESLVPKFMRDLVRRVYVQGAVSTGDADTQADGAASEQTFARSLDFLIELYFPHNIVGSGRFAPGSWGVDVVWEP